MARDALGFQQFTEFSINISAYGTTSLVGVGDSLGDRRFSERDLYLFAVQDRAEIALAKVAVGGSTRERHCISPLMVVTALITQQGPFSLGGHWIAL